MTLCIVLQPKRDFWPSLVLADLVPFTVDISHRYVHKDIESDVDI